MPCKREWDSSCPRVYDRWEAAGLSWVVQDLPPEDDELAVQLLVDHLATDEVLCSTSALHQDPVSVKSIAEFWRASLAQRMSLPKLCIATWVACYAEQNGQRTLAALNCCLAQCKGENDETSNIEGEAWINVFNGLKYVEEKTDAFSYLGVDKLLYAMGLVVRRDYRGAALAARVLAAREPLALSQGLKGTSTVFTGVASQKSAAKAGFTAINEVTMAELADAGLKYPRDDRILKLMVKKFDA